MSENETIQERFTNELHDFISDKKLEYAELYPYREGFERIAIKGLRAVEDDLREIMLDDVMERVNDLEERIEE